jgi:non-specific serine/threonine protein kinase/serine/threonine-protein kinase
VVFQAEQQEPVRRTVALKLIKAGMDTEQVVARFESERQALALMDHPGIARVFDAGATDQGRPYFVMEYVRGEPISAYCDRHRLSTAERLVLFVQVCEAVHHAHQKGIIHRDIKPSNVLVTEQDGKPVPKIIDFGVAKATQQRLTERTLFTQLGAMVGTPEYMSPEQAELTGLDIDTRTDVYSLGVLLYELLVGALPFDSRELRQGAFDEMRRRIREDEPSRPSSRLSTLGDASEESARRRRTDRRALTRQLRGDLDWITMKALEKERERRYASANEFAEDLRRHLDDHPVAAGPPRLGYQVGKFVRRHRWGVAAGALVVFASALGLVGTTYGLIRATRAEGRALREATAAERVSEFLVGLFEVSDPEEGLGERITARELLDEGTARIDVELVDQPLIRARLTHTMGRVYRGLGLYEQADGLLDAALEVRRDSLGEAHPATYESMHELGVLRARQSRYDDAERLLRRVIDFRERTLGGEDPETLESRAALARSYTYQERLDEAESLLTATLDAQQRTLGRAHPDTLTTATWLARVQKEQVRFGDAESLLTETLKEYERALGAEHPQTLLCEYLLADAYFAHGRYELAEPLFLHNLDVRQRVLGIDHPDTLSTKSELAYVYIVTERHTEAAKLVREVLEVRRRIFGTEHRNTLYSINALGYIYKVLGRLDEAEALTREALEVLPRVLDKHHRVHFDLMHNLAEIRAAQGHLEEAETMFLETLEARRDALGHDHLDTAETLNMLANLRRDDGRYEEAGRLYEEALGVVEKHVGPDHWRVVRIRDDQAELNRRLGSEGD